MIEKLFAKLAVATPGRFVSVPDTKLYRVTTYLASPNGHRHELASQFFRASDFDEAARIAKPVPEFEPNDGWMKVQQTELVTNDSFLATAFRILLNRTMDLVATSLYLFAMALINAAVPAAVHVGELDYLLVLFAGGTVAVMLYQDFPRSTATWQ